MQNTATEQMFENLVDAAQSAQGADIRETFGDGWRSDACNVPPMDVSRQCFDFRSGRVITFELGPKQHGAAWSTNGQPRNGFGGI